MDNLEKSINEKRAVTEYPVNAPNLPLFLPLCESSFFSYSSWTSTVKRVFFRFVSSRSQCGDLTRVVGRTFKRVSKVFVAHPS